MKQYKVLLVSAFPPPYGGIANYGKNLFNGLVKKGIIIERYDTSRYDKYRFHIPDKNRNYIRIIHPINLFFLLLVISDFFLFLFSISFKRNLIVHVHTSSYFGWWRSAIYIIIARLIGKKTILHVHNAIDRFYLKESGILGKYLIRITLNIPHHVISLSEGIKDLLVKLTNKPVTPIYNGVDVERFQFEKKYTKPCKMLFAGFVGPQKGVSDLLEAVKRSGLGKEELQLTVMGMGDVGIMEELSKKLNINKQVTFTGHVNDKYKLDLFKTHHILTLPSHGEGQPVVIFEGMASGMAILSTKVGSIPEVVKEDNGILVAAGDIKKLSEAIISIVRKTDVETMGKINRNKACEMFTFDRVINDNITVYETVSE